MPPSIGKCLPETRSGGDQASDEDGATAAKHLVHGICKPAANESTAEIWRRVNKTKKPRVTFALATNAECHLVEGLGTVDDCLVHTLDRGAE
jgi:hypothetical protein